MLAYVVAALEPLFGDNFLVVAGHQAERVRAAFPHLKFTLQAEQLGTGHALANALPDLECLGPQRALVINGDAPLVTTATIDSFLEAGENADIAFATLTLAESGSYGRVVRKNGQVTAIIEARDYDCNLHGQPTGEVNAGLYLLKIAAIRELLPQLDNNNKNHEYYLTDLIGLGIAAGLKVAGIPCGSGADLLGINSPLELAEAEDILAARTVRDLLAKDVIIHNPAALRPCPLAEIAPGAVLNGPCEIHGPCRIAAEAEVGPYCVIINSRIGENAKIRPFSHLEDSMIGRNCLVGPYTRLRPGANLEEDAHAGNFVELKKATLGRGAKANHLSYLGDAEIGAGTNIGAGTITCNYDGKNKFQTKIGANAFIGSNSALVAPVEIGDSALVGAGSVITENVPPGDLALGRARQINKPR